MSEEQSTHVFRRVWDEVFAVKPDPEALADLTMDEDERLAQEANLRKRKVLDPAEYAIAFYNNAIVTPPVPDKTASCIFLTQRRFVQLKGGELDLSHDFEEIRKVHVEHNNLFKYDYVVLTLKSGGEARYAVVRESVGNAFMSLLEQLVDAEAAQKLLAYRG